MAYYIVLEKDIEKASSYIPMKDKVAFVNEVAEKCFDKINVTAGNTPLPPMFKENAEIKARYLMGFLVREYFKESFIPMEDETYLMSSDDYDYYAGGHILNQIERMKSVANIRDKCFDILSDYRLLEKMLNVEVYGLALAMNDTLSRVSAVVDSLGTPENFNSILKEFEALKGVADELPKEFANFPTLEE